jgi:hypothetical protein
MVITDGWQSYGFLNNNNDYIHETYVHGSNGILALVLTPLIILKEYREH